MSTNLYHTQKPQIIMREYGRNVQNIVRHILGIEDKEQRTRQAYNLIELMRQLNPNVRQEAEYEQKLWDHLHIMSGFRLEVDSPYPAPEPEEIQKKPARMAYRRKVAVGKHFGLNIEKVIEKAAQIEDDTERYEATLKAVSMIRHFYAAWNRENLEDSTIIDLFRRCSKGKLIIDAQDLRRQAEAQGPISTPPPRKPSPTRHQSQPPRKTFPPQTNNRRR